MKARTPSTSSAASPPAPIAEQPKRRKRRTRDLTKAVTLTPSEVTALYGMSKNYWNDMCRNSDPAKRIPSKKIPGRKGRLGSRLIDHEQLKAWLAKWEVK